MMRRQFVQKTDRTAVAAFEATIGVRLPEDYRNFLLTYNGGQPDNANFRFGPPDQSYAESSVRYFLSITDEPSFSLAYHWEIYVAAERVPANMLPIAVDYGGNLILLAINEPETEAVYFWDHEIEGIVANPAAPESVKYIAHNFDAFYEILTP